MLKKVTGVPADIEALRLFLIFPEVIPHIDMPNRVNFIAKFGEKILDQEKEAIKIICKSTFLTLCKCLALQNIDVVLVKNYLFHLFTHSSSYPLVH